MDKYAAYCPPIGPDIDFITITLNPSWYSRKACDQFKQSKDMVKQILKKFSNEFFLIAELTKAGNVHYHGWIRYINNHDTVRLHIQDTLKVIGLSHLKNINGTPEKILEYMTKQLTATQQFIHNPIVKYKKKRVKYENQSGVSGASGGNSASETAELNAPRPLPRIIDITQDMVFALDENMLEIEIEVP